MNLIFLIGHAAWMPERKATLERLVNALPKRSEIVVESSEAPEHANVWARRLWERAASYDEKDCDACVFLNDDVIPHPDIDKHVEQLLSLVPSHQAISLHAQFPGVRAVADMGLRLARCYWPSGPAYVLSPRAARSLLEWLATTPEGWFGGGDVNEDGALASYLWSRQAPAYCSIPALVRHDTTVKSSLGYEHHPMRTSPVDWDFFKPGEWTEASVAAAPYVAVPWMSDDSLRKLGESLKGIRALCCFCGANPSQVFHRKRTAAGLCEPCLHGIVHAMTPQARMEAP